MSLIEQRLAWARLARSGRGPALRIALLATYTIDPLTPYLGMALEAAGLPAEIRVGPFDQIAIQCLDPASETAAYRPDVLVVHPRLEDLWAGLPTPLAGPSEPYAEAASTYASAAVEAGARWGATVVFVLPAVPDLRPLGVGDAGNAAGVFATANAVRETLRRHLAGRAGVLIADMEAELRAIGTEAAEAPALWATARIPYAEAAFARLGAQLARLIALSRLPARKVVAVDADGTLWGGVVGEDGPDGVVLGDRGPGAAHVAFQRYLLALREAGVLLVLASKNEEADVWAAFARPEMVLKREHLADWRIGWNPKSESLMAMAETLRLGLESFCLIDDNPAELAEVGARCPQVAGLLMPADPAGWRQALSAERALDRLPPTAEDRARPQSYAQERERAAIREALTPEAYLAALGLSVRITEAAEPDLPRLAQLVAKTNQFNLTCRRRDAAALAALVGSPGAIVRLASARDRFGDYGVVGAAIALETPDGATLDTFLLSCRAMGRGIERAMLADLQARSAQRGFGPLVAAIETHPRNEPARRFFAELGATDTPGPLAECAWPVHLAIHEEVSA